MSDIPGWNSDNSVQFAPFKTKDLFWFWLISASDRVGAATR